MSTICLNRKCSKVVGISSNIFGKVGKSSENRRKSLEVARTFSEILVMTMTTNDDDDDDDLVMTRQKSHV